MKRTKDNHLASIRRQSHGKYQLEGDINFDSVSVLLADSLPLFSQDQGDWEIDLSGVGRANSAALGLMLEWVRLARKQRRGIQFRHVPEQLLAIAHVSDLDYIMPIPH